MIDNYESRRLHKELSFDRKKIVVFIGAPRSGTTLVAYLLGLHPNALISNESRLIQNVVLRGKQLKTELIKSEKITDVDFIKMDIEGAELNALKGSLTTIQKFKPKLAISVYHSLEDYSSILLWLRELNLGYKFYLRHFTIHAEETILFAISD